jgi:hypothetical protein
MQENVLNQNPENKVGTLELDLVCTLELDLGDMSCLESLALELL